VSLTNRLYLALPLEIAEKQHRDTQIRGQRLAHASTPRTYARASSGATLNCLVQSRDECAPLAQRWARILMRDDQSGVFPSSRCWPNLNELVSPGILKCPACANHAGSWSSFFFPTSRPTAPAPFSTEMHHSVSVFQQCIRAEAPQSSPSSGRRGDSFVSEAGAALPASAKNKTPPLRLPAGAAGLLFDWKTIAAERACVIVCRTPFYWRPDGA
jgi:hypothetical protein